MAHGACGMASDSDDWWMCSDVTKMTKRDSAIAVIRERCQYHCLSHTHITVWHRRKRDSAIAVIRERCQYHCLDTHTSLSGTEGREIMLVL